MKNFEERTDKEYIKSLHKVIYELQRKIRLNDREIRRLQLELEVTDDMWAEEIHKITQDYESVIENITKPSLN
jgi:hypothetical protein